MSLDGIIKGSKYGKSYGGFADSINKTVKRQAKENKPLPEEENKEAKPQDDITPPQEKETQLADIKNVSSEKEETQEANKTEVHNNEEDKSEKTVVQTGSEQKKQGRGTSKKKAGRKKELGDVKKILVYIPIDLVDDIEAAAAIIHKGNVNSYIRSLIVKDIKENRKTYDKITELMKQTEK